VFLETNLELSFKCAINEKITNIMPSTGKR